MPHFFTVTPPPGSVTTEACLGPFSTTEEAERSRTAMLSDGVPHGTTVSEVFQESLSWFMNRPRPQTHIPQQDGSTLEIWTDGSQRILPPV